MKALTVTTLLALLAACQSTPKLEDDVRYVRLARVIDIREFTDLERKQARANQPSDSRVGFGFGVGMGSGGSFGGMSVGIGSRLGERPFGRAQPPSVADGANRITVQPIGITDRVEVMSYGQHKVGDCVKVLATHPTQYPRFFELKPGESCEQAPASEQISPP